MRDARRRVTALERAASSQIERALARLTGEDAHWFLSRPLTPDGLDFDWPRWSDHDLSEATRRLNPESREAGNARHQA